MRLDWHSLREGLLRRHKRLSRLLLLQPPSSKLHRHVLHTPVGLDDRDHRCRSRRELLLRRSHLLHLGFLPRQMLGLRRILSLSQILLSSPLLLLSYHVVGLRVEVVDGRRAEVEAVGELATRVESWLASL